MSQQPNSRRPGGYQQHNNAVFPPSFIPSIPDSIKAAGDTDNSALNDGKIMFWLYKVIKRGQNSQSNAVFGKKLLQDKVWMIKKIACARYSFFSKLSILHDIPYFDF